MSNRNIEALTHITDSLVDSQRGYQSGAAIANDHALGDHPKRPSGNMDLSSRFQKRAKRRRALIAEFRNQIRAYGEHPAATGGNGGAVEQDFKDFAALFNKDEAAALSAIDKGEESLAAEIEFLLREYSRLSQSTKRLLRQAYNDAKSRQRLAFDIE